MFENETVRTLGLYQPFAGLMLHGKIETRWIRQGRKPPFPLGKYLIYSTLNSYTPLETSLISGHQYARIKEKKGIYEKSAAYPEFILTGHALCIGELEKIIYIIPNNPEMAAKTFVDYKGPRVEDKNGADVTYVLVGLVFSDIRPIKPFRFKGKQGIGFLNDQDKSKIKFI